MKYYIFEYRSRPTGVHFGRRSFRAKNEKQAWEKVRSHLSLYWPNVEHTITLISIEPA